MEYHLDREIRLTEQTELASLYKWSLQEFDNDGKAVSSELIPWWWTLHFTASELNYRKGIEIEDSSKDATSERISATLNPEGNKILAVSSPARYSMFGTSRKIKDFTLNIRRLTDSQEKQVCEAWGIVSYTSEVDFRDNTENDILGFEVFLNDKNFEEFKSFLIFKSNEDELRFSVCGSGFYSEWSPGISTDNIKILASGSEQKVSIPAGNDIEPPRLGEISEFSISMSRKNILAVKNDQSENETEIEDSYEEKIDNEPKGGLPTSEAALLVELVKAQNGILKLRWPLWIIAVILVMLLLSK